ncbi:PQQ-dependent sugar dehydrogenase [Streptomyces sp. NPDC001777]|uniref:PQQ-dependent sugar dehydrogenase n=1 Tax=Streptomyces sp. NPDC001777 TaxID=3364608 RepID=UPI003686E69E
MAGRAASALLAPLVVSAVLAGCTSRPDASPSGQPSATPPASRPGESSTGADDGTAVASGLEAPWSIAFDGDAALLSERDSGRILGLDADGDQREVGTIEGVTPMREGGLLGIAVRDDHLYAYFTAGDENRLERFPLTGEPGSLGLGEPETILDGLDSASYHNGGRIAFGPDGMLYVTVGDAGNSPAAQDRGSLSGKILRLTPDGNVPADNPFEGSPIYSYGHRNPQGLAWDDDGTMYASEFGQDTWDELNVIEPGRNYGWPTVEGIAHDYRFVDPVQQWSPANASPSGMAIADGSIWIANLRGERLREVPLDDTSSSTEHLVGEHGRLRDVAVAPNGALWVLTNNTDGRGDPGPDDDRILRLDLD